MMVQSVTKSLLYVTLLKVFVASEKSWFADVPMGPADKILGVADGFNKDPNPRKMNLGVGAYRHEDGKPYVLPAIREAERRVFVSHLDHEYANIEGNENFTRLAAELAYGEDCSALREKRLAIVQGISGSGSLRVGSAFLQKFYPGVKTVYFPTPTWNGHLRFCTDSQLNVGSYRYFDNKTNGLDFVGMMEDIKAIPKKSILFLQTSGHNPTGVDLSEQQWKELAAVVKQRQLYPFFDMAYAGLTTGDFNRDAFSLRYFAQEVGQLCLAQSFSKNMGLYGERVGTFSVMTASPDEAARIMSQLKILIRGFYSNPPIHGARIAHMVLQCPDLRRRWFQELKGMSDRIYNIRRDLKKNLEDLRSKKNWDHIVNQKGMFCYTGLSPVQVQKLIKEHSVHMTVDGRISLGAVNKANVKYLAKAIHTVTKD